LGKWFPAIVVCSRFGQARDEGSTKPTVLGDLNGREKSGRKDDPRDPEKSKDAGNLWDLFGTEAGRSWDSSELAQRLAEVERRERAVLAREEELKQRERQLWMESAKPVESGMGAPTAPASGTIGAVGSVGRDKDGPSSAPSYPSQESLPIQGIQGIPTPSKPDLSDPQGRLEYSQRLIEKRKDLERWQQTLEEKSKALLELEKSLGNGISSKFSGPFLSYNVDDVVNVASVAGKAMVGAGFAASKVLVAIARPIFGGIKIAGSAAIQFGVSSYTAAVAYANEEAQARAMAQATALRRSKYYATASSPMQSMGSMGSVGMAPPDFCDGSGVPPRPAGRPYQSPQVWSRGSMWSPGWQVSPIYPASPAPHLAPVMEREGLVAWMRRNSGCGTRNHAPNYPVRYPTTR